MCPASLSAIPFAPKLQVPSPPAAAVVRRDRLGGLLPTNTASPREPTLRTQQDHNLGPGKPSGGRKGRARSRCTRRRRGTSIAAMFARPRRRSDDPAAALYLELLKL